MNEDLITNILLILYLISTSLFFYYVWFRKGDEKISEWGMESIKTSVDPKPDAFYRFQWNPGWIKFGGVVFMIGNFIIIFSLIIENI